MSPTRAFLGIASGLPALTTLALPHLAELVRQPGAVWAVLALLAAGLVAMFAFVWIAAGAQKPWPWRLGWVLRLTLFGAGGAGVLVHARAPARPGSR